MRPAQSQEGDSLEAPAIIDAGKIVINLCHGYKVKILQHCAVAMVYLPGRG